MSNNILESFVDLGIEAGKLGIKTLFKLLNIKPLFDIENYFKIVGLKNQKDKFPKEVKKIKSNLGYTHIFSIPEGLNIEDFKKHKLSLEQQINKSIKIEFSYGYIHITVIEKELEKLINYKLPIRSKDIGIKIPIGEALEETIILDLNLEPHSYIVGTTNSGKSVCSKVILTSLISMYKPYELDLWLCDLKRVELSLFSNLKFTKRFEYTVDGTTQAISDLLNEVNQRYDKCMSLGVTNANDYNKLVGSNKRMKYSILFIEEIVMLLESKNKKAMKLLKQLIAISRAVNVYVIATTQRPSVDVLDATVKANIGNKISFKVEDSKNSIIAIDCEGAELLSGQGHGIIKRGAIKQEFRGYYITDSQVKEYTSKYISSVSNSKSRNDISLKTEIKFENKGNREAQTIDKKDLLEDLSFLDNL